MGIKLRSNIMLLLAAFIWGFAFVAQREGMDYVGPYTFNFIRSLLAVVALIIVVLVMSLVRSKRKNRTPIYSSETAADSQSGAIHHRAPASRKVAILAGVLCGICLFAAQTLQQYGLITSSASKAGFLTALYIVLVPVFGIFIGKKIRPLLWICVFIALLGVWLLAAKGGFAFEMGDILLILCGVGYTFHIMTIDHFTSSVNGIFLSLIQFFVCGVLSMIGMLIFETPSWSAIMGAAIPLLYTGIMSSAVAYTFQILGQKGAQPTIAALLMSLESVFAAIGGWLILSEQLSGKEMLGCAIMFLAIVLSQLPEKKKEKL